MGSLGHATRMRSGETVMKAAGSIALVVLAVAFGASPVRSADIKPAVVYDIGGKFDKSFNEGVYTGAEKFKAETSSTIADFEVTNETQCEQARRRFAQRGQDPIVGVGFSQANRGGEVAKEFPKVRFRAHRWRGRAAECAVDPVQGA